MRRRQILYIQNEVAEIMSCFWFSKFEMSCATRTIYVCLFIGSCVLSTPKVLVSQRPRYLVVKPQRQTRATVYRNYLCSADHTLTHDQVLKRHLT